MQEKNHPTPPKKMTQKANNNNTDNSNGKQNVKNNRPF